MILTSVRKFRNKIVLHFDNSETLEIAYEVYLNSGLIKGDEVDKKKLEKLKYENEFFQTKSSAYRYLGNRNHSSFELRVKLTKKGYQKLIIEKVIKDLRAKGYIDDQKFTESFVKNRIEKRKEGIVKINSELKKKGISNEIISDVINNFTDDPIHFQNALQLARKKYQSLKNKDLDFQKLKGRLFNFLKGKGYTTEIILKVLDTVLVNEGEDELEY
ncbi:MAG: regulatory protein RecX [Chlorobi bacterium]|nr:regulatory protein RecX [Chlorobiota bacterium]